MSLAGFTVFAACLIFTFHRKEILSDSRDLSKGRFGYCFILAWLCVPLLLVSGVLYVHLRKKQWAKTRKGWKNLIRVNHFTINSTKRTRGNDDWEWNTSLDDTILFTFWFSIHPTVLHVMQDIMSSWWLSLRHVVTQDQIKITEPQSCCKIHILMCYRKDSDRGILGNECITCA